MKSWRLVIVLLISLIIVGSVACELSTEDEEASQQVEVVRGDFIVSVSGGGRLELTDEAQLTFGIAGRLDKILVEDGSAVSRGEVLARLETDSLELAVSQAQLAYTTAELTVTQAELTVTQAELAVTQAQLALDTAELNLKTAENLYEWPELEIAQANVDKARSSVERAQYYLSEATTSEDIADRAANLLLAEAYMVAEGEKLNAMLSGDDTDEVALKRLALEAAQQSLETTRLSLETTRSSLEVTQQSLELAVQSLEQAQTQLAKTVVTAPFDGVIVSVSVDPGDTVSTVTPIIYLIDPAKLELNVEIDEIDLPGVKVGQRVIIEFDALTDRLFDGTVSSLSLVPTMISGIVAYDTKVVLDIPSDIELRSGMSATADIVVAEEKDVLLVPERVIQRDSQGNTIVEVVINEEIEERAVVTGISDGFFTVITDGLEDGEMVIEKRGRSN